MYLSIYTLESAQEAVKVFSDLAAKCLADLEALDAIYRIINRTQETPQESTANVLIIQTLIGMRQAILNQIEDRRRDVVVRLYDADRQTVYRDEPHIQDLSDQCVAWEALRTEVVSNVCIPWLPYRPDRLVFNVTL